MRFHTEVHPSRPVERDIETLPSVGRWATMRRSFSTVKSRACVRCCMVGCMCVQASVSTASHINKVEVSTIGSDCSPRGNVSS